MAAYIVQRAAARRIDEILLYTEETWGRAQAETYVRGLFDCFEAIAQHRIPWRAIPAEFEVRGYFCRYRHHFVYWKEFDDGRIGIVTVLHERMNLMTRFRDDFSGRSDV